MEGTPGVLEAHLQVLGARAAGVHREVAHAGEPLEVDVVDPGDVVTVGVLIVDVEGAGTRFGRLDDLDDAVEPDRVLRKVDEELAPLDGELLHAPARGLVAVKGLLEARAVGAHEGRRGERRHGVVDHVEAVVGDVRRAGEARARRIARL